MKIEIFAILAGAFVVAVLIICIVFDVIDQRHQAYRMAEKCIQLTGEDCKIIEGGR